MTVEENIQAFKMQLLRVMPFYGDLLTMIPIVPNPAAGTARTNGRKIEYAPAYFSTLRPGELNFVLMHELLHVLLGHCERIKGRDPQLWNTATDLIVNHMLSSVGKELNDMHVPFGMPEDAIFGKVSSGQTAEELYGQLVAKNQGREASDPVTIVSVKWNQEIQVNALADLQTPPGDGEKGEDGSSETELVLSRKDIEQLIQETLEKNRSNIGAYFVPPQLYSLSPESRKLPWNRLLREFLEEKESEESSYATPERKYLHMDLILPGHSRDTEELEEVWAFVDCSGSVKKEEMEQFLTQLYRIVKEFNSHLNLCYWDTKVEEVYRNIRKPADILLYPPHHSGGTDINCVYEWLRGNRVDPNVMLILTDGYFGKLKEELFHRKLQKKTVLVLSTEISKLDQTEMERIGRTAYLTD